MHVNEREAEIYCQLNLIKLSSISDYNVEVHRIVKPPQAMIYRILHDYLSVRMTYAMKGKLRC